ncbi:MAG: nuclear transport factor 2 family protein [Flavobacterium sp.]|nr:MAG: nuclear transport factor 2 family protein [Flavobacterium sp.]
MTSNEQIIRQFYTAFQQKNYKTMQDSYADNAVFNDAVFTNLDAKEVKAMWQMLISRGGDMTMTFGNIKEAGNKVTAYWEAHYTFTATGRKVVNKINAEFELENGKIVKHTDDFSFYKWAKQAFGAGGFLLGWTSAFKAKIGETAKKKLDEYIAKTNLQ